MIKTILVFFLMLMFPFIAMGEKTNTDSYSKLLRSKSLKCTFENGFIGLWKEGKLKIEKDTMKDPIIFDSIDPKNGTARMIAHQGSTDVTVLATLSGLTFWEVTGTGNQVFTVVYPEILEGTDSFIAVHSRHIRIFVGKPLSSQYHGYCEEWNL